MRKEVIWNYDNCTKVHSIGATVPRHRRVKASTGVAVSQRKLNGKDHPKQRRIDTKEKNLMDWIGVRYGVVTVAQDRDRWYAQR